MNKWLIILAIFWFYFQKNKSNKILLDTDNPKGSILPDLAIDLANNSQDQGDLSADPSNDPAIDLDDWSFDLDDIDILQDSEDHGINGISDLGLGGYVAIDPKHEIIKDDYSCNGDFDPMVKYSCIK